MVGAGMAKLSSGVREPAGYRWIVVGVSTAVSGLAWGARSTFALFYVAMLTELAWGRGPTALGYSLSWLAFVALAPVAGWLHDRWGARTVVTIGGLVLGLALALTGQVASWFAARPAATTRDVVTSLAKSTGA
jgi:OFA family oxalate/formate antiporter-like MFS transporter